VVPQIVPDLVAGLGTLVDVDPTIIGPDSKLPITLDVDEPRTVGADRVVNTLAACELYKRDTIVVDLARRPRSTASPRTGASLEASLRRAWRSVPSN